MIVKNESRIIERMLNSVYPFVNSFCICDTGSTDNTVELIHNFAREKNIQNYIVYTEPFKNFEYNRTHALHKCLELPELPTYILLIDADMILKFGNQLDMEQLRQGLCVQDPPVDAYFINQGNDGFYYKNVRMLRAKLLLDEEKPSYKGVTHEYLNIPGSRRYVDIIKDVIFINDVGDGGSKQDKFTRDIALLTEGLENDPKNTRYMYYLSNSYKDFGDHNKAIEMYKKCIESGGWVEERWQCHYQIGKLCYGMERKEEAIYHWLEGYQLLPNRLENIYEIVKHYRVSGKNTLAYMFYNIARVSPSMKDTPVFLFLEKDVYDYKLDYEFSIFGYYHNPDKINMAKHSSKVLKRILIQQAIHANVLSNYKFYTERLYKHNQVTSIPELKSMAMLKAFGNIGYTYKDKKMYSSSPSMVFTPDNKLYICERKVNYFIRPDGSYENDGNIATKNHIIVMDTSKNGWDYITHSELEYNTSLNDYYIGIEDVKLFYNPTTNQVCYTGTRPLPRNNGIAIEYGNIVPVGSGLPSFKTENSFLLVHPDKKRCEKNWVFFIDASGNEKVIYEWNASTGINIGDLVDHPEGGLLLDNGERVHSKVFKQTHLVEATNILPKETRGSTNGVIIGSEIWFICHIVSHEGIRNYYHIIVVLDATTYKLKCVSDLFKMSESAIEYVLGLSYIPQTDKLFIGYSTMDRTTDYVFIERKLVIDKLHMEGMNMELPSNKEPLETENVVLSIIN